MCRTLSSYTAINVNMSFVCKSQFTLIHNLTEFIPVEPLLGDLCLRGPRPHPRPPNLAEKNLGT